jgi:hypothetical protein
MSGPDTSDDAVERHYRRLMLSYVVEDQEAAALLRALAAERDRLDADARRLLARSDLLSANFLKQCRARAEAEAERDAAARVCEALWAYKMAPGTTAWERMTQAHNAWRAARGGSDGR